LSEEIQIPQSSLRTERPIGVNGRPMHGNGGYVRRKNPNGDEEVKIPRYRDPVTGKTASVLPEGCVPYRPVRAERLEAYFNFRSGNNAGLDPPPKPIEAGCLRRAWLRLSKRQDQLRGAFDQLIPLGLDSVEKLWSEILKAKSRLSAILGFLFEKHKISLLGDYACCRGWASEKG
jgi:hypothetical protein